MGWVKQTTGIDIGNPLGSASDLITNTFNAAVNTVNTTFNTVQAILKNPLPVVAQVVGASFGVPPYVTAAVIAGVQGGNIGDMAKSAALSYASSELMSSTQLGADIKNYAVNMPSGDITDWAMENFNLSPDQAVMVAKASSAALNSSVIGGINAALTGRSVAQGVSSGFTSGLIYSSTDSYFNSVNKDPNWGFSPTALNVMKGAASTALNTLVSGKGDPAQTVGNYIAYAGVNMAGSEVSRMAKDAYVNLTTDTEAAQKAQDKFTTYKAELDSKAVEAENLRQSIIQRDSDLQKAITEKYTPFKTQYDQLGSVINTAKEKYDTWKASYDVWVDYYNRYAPVPFWGKNEYMQMLINGIKDHVVVLDDEEKRIKDNSLAAQKLYENNKPLIDYIESENKLLPQKVAELQAIKSDIEAPNADGTNLAAKAMAASKEYETKYAAWSKTKAAADTANENYTKALAEVATRNATIDALNSGAIKATETDADGNWVLNNGMTLTKDGKFMQDGQQAFTNAAGVDQNKIDFKDAGGKQVSFDENSIFNTAFAKSQDARSSLMNELNQSNLTSDERTALNAAMQDVFAQSSTAQALPATSTDASTGTSRLGSAFAANDPKFQIALAKNPNLARAFNEYTNTYGFAGVAMDANYSKALEEALLQTPNDSNLQAEYKKVTGKDYQAPISEAERIRQENAAKDLTPLTPVDVDNRDVVNVDVTGGDTTAADTTGAADITENTGTTDTAGTTGATDTTGTTGITDTTGITGTTDTTGITGITGITGTTGTTSTTGAIDNVGATNTVGTTSATDTAGATNTTGAANTTGATNVVGNTDTSGATQTAANTGTATTNATDTAGATQSTGAAGATTGTTGTTGTTSTTETGTQTNLADVQAQYAALTAAQKAEVNARIQQGENLQTAITNSQAATQQQINGLSQTQAQQYNQLSQGQQSLYNQLVAQGASQTDALNTAISGVQGQITAGQQQTQQQITGLETSTQAKFDALTAAQKELVASQAKQGVDLATAINNVSQTTTQQITDVKTNIVDMQTQFNNRVDELMKQGQDYQTATNTAIKEIGTGVAGLQTNLTQLQAQQAAEKAKAEAAAKAARATKAQQGISQNLANAAAMVTPALAAGAMDESIPGTKDIGLKTSGEAKFEGPLDQYLKMVKENTYVPKPQQPQQQNQQGAPMQDALTPSQQGSDYFAYGQQPEMNDLLGGSSGGDLLYSKEGGLAVPMMAGGGSTRYGKYAGGGLNVINHSGKARLDFRKGDAVTGPGDGQSDDIPAMLADGEFVFPADVVAALGNGSTKAGSDKLYEMMHSIRAYHRSAKPKDLPPPAKKSPLDYLKKSKARR